MNYWLQLQGPKDFKTTLENSAKVEETLINNDMIKLSKDGKGFSTNSTQRHHSSDRSIDKHKSWWRNNNRSTTSEGVVEADHVKTQTQSPLDRPGPISHLNKIMPDHFTNVT